MATMLVRLISNFYVIRASPSCIECKKLHQNICNSFLDIAQSLTHTHTHTHTHTYSHSHTQSDRERETHTDGKFFIAFLISGTLKMDISGEKSIY
ncbi:hypothetical protein O3M35_010346 [Rhynocoris fuscipes]|uniref:Uncharacterized protein n=1 Tax=Rhynocoris fuscipes TaxID=488301 RepID=A0AAW1D6B0_9HEMI